jgi:hypothetical protein
MLIERGVDVNACTRSKNTALHLLLRNLSQDIDAGSDPTTQPMAYLYRPMEESERASIRLKKATIESYVSLLIRSGASPNVRNNVKLSYRPAALLLTPCLWLCLSLSLSSRFFKPLCRWRSPSKPFLWFICYWMRAIASKSVFEDSSSPLLSSLTPRLQIDRALLTQMNIPRDLRVKMVSVRLLSRLISPLSAHLSSTITFTGEIGFASNMEPGTGNSILATQSLASLPARTSADLSENIFRGRVAGAGVKRVREGLS